MRYIHIPTGTLVTSAAELPKALFAKVDTPKAEPQPKPIRKRATKKE